MVELLLCPVVVVAYQSPLNNTEDLNVYTISLGGVVVFHDLHSLIEPDMNDEESP